MKNLKYFLFIIVSLFLTIGYFTKLHDNSVNSLVEEKLADYKLENKVVLDIFRDYSNEIYNGLLNTHEVKTLVFAEDRQGLYDLLKNDFKRLKEVGITNIHFHTEDGFSFLRMHRPETYGDDLRSIRHTIDTISKRQKKTEAFEIGRSYPSYRFLYPLYIAQMYIGSVEISYPLEVLVNKLDKIYNVHTHILIKSSIVRDTDFFSEYKYNYVEASENSLYSYVKDVHVKKQHIHDNDFLNQNPELLRTIREKMTKGDTFSLPLDISKKNMINQTIKNHHFLMSFLPVYDLENKLISYVVLYEKNALLHNLEIEMYTYMAISCFIILLLAFIYFRQNKRKQLLVDLVKDRTKQLDKELLQNKKLNKNLENSNEKLLLHQKELNAQNEELIHTKLQLENKYNEIEALFNNIKNPTFITDNSFKILDSNHEAKNIFHIDTKLNNINFILGFVKDKDKFYNLVKLHQEDLSDTITFSCKNNKIKRFKTNIIKHPIYDDKLVISLIDIEKELQTQEELRQKDIMIYENAKLVSIKDMISNIAHHWRQPLNLIAITASSSKIELDYDVYEKEQLKQNFTQINKAAQELSSTIEIFGNYLNKVGEAVNVNIKEIIDQAITIEKAFLDELYIDVNVNIQGECNLYTYKEDFVEVFINLINNTKDAVLSKEIKNPLIKIDVIEENNILTITYEDNAEGVTQEHLSKLFEPYFTTKFKSTGVGLSLFITKRIVTEKLNGQIKAQNNENGLSYIIDINLD